jgi:Ca2+-binding RTX toxin-like protein
MTRPHTTNLASKSKTLFSVGSNFLYGETGDDWVGCSGNSNLVNGAQGNDYLAATGNANLFDGGAGNDMLVLAALTRATVSCSTPATA